MNILNPRPSARRGKLMLLAPSTGRIPRVFQRLDVDPVRHSRALAGAQRLRGRVYLQDGAIHATQLSPDGRLVQAIDDKSWHVVSIRPDDGEVVGCARYCEHDEDVAPEDLGVWKSPLARHDVWSHWLHSAVASEIALARRRRVAYVEVGGWAVAETSRFTPEALEIALATYALAETSGGCIGITTATVRNCSSRMLRKLGGRGLEVAGGELPPYYDPQYRCEMEVLRFESSGAHPKFRPQIDRLASAFLDLPVLCTVSSVPATTPTLRRRPGRHLPAVRHGRPQPLHGTEALVAHAS